MDLTTNYLKNIMPPIPGWFYEHDAACFVALNQIQKARGVVGALAEVGVYCGKALGLLATFRGTDERVYGFDLFTGDASIDYTRQVIQRAVGDLAGTELIAADSLELPNAKLREIVTQPIRFLHIDGGHEYHEALSDLRKFGSLVGPGGVIAVDDYYDRDFPGVCAATNEYSRETQFVPFLAGYIKIYLCRGEDLESYIRSLLTLTPFHQSVRVARFRDRPMLVAFSAKPQPRGQVLKEIT